MGFEAAPSNERLQELVRCAAMGLESERYLARYVWSGELRPSLNLSQVGYRMARFEGCPAFTPVTGLHARPVAHGDPLDQRLRC